MTMHPAPFGGNLFWQAPATAVYLPPMPWPVKNYDLPRSASDVALWSDVQLHALANATPIVKKILPNGFRQGHLWMDQNFIVTLRRRLIPEANRLLGRGGWVCPSTGAWGENVVDLYAYVNNRPYWAAVHALAAEAKIMGSTDENYRQDQRNHWYQERDPLSQDCEAYHMPSQYPYDSEIQVYVNPSGHPILRAVRAGQTIGEKVCMYWSLWSHRSGSGCQWAEIFPQPPFPVFNIHLVPQRSHAPVVLVEDEFVAARMSQNNPTNAIIAVPGGMKNLAKADRELLRGRQLLVAFGPHDLEEGHRIHHALQTAGVRDAWFSVEQGELFKPFVKLESVAAQRGVKLLPPPLEGSVSRPTPLVIAAGEKIPGGDEVRRNLLYPIIRAGDIIWLYADPKSGKTWLALAMAYAVARGDCELGRWHAADAVGVLFVDGEMKPDQLQESISLIMAGAGDLAEAAPFDIICAQALNEGLIDITADETQRAIEAVLKEKTLKLLILDNIQALTSNRPSAVDQLFPWIRKLARAGIAVIVVDHTNSHGEVQGSSAKERIPDLLIALSRPDGSVKGDGQILVEFPFARRLHGADGDPCNLQMVFTDTTLRFEVVEPEANNRSSLEPNALKRVQKMALAVFARDHERLSYPEIRKKYGISQSTAHGYYNEAPKLSDDERVAFDNELHHLIDGGSPPESNCSN